MISTSTRLHQITDFSLQRFQNGKFDINLMEHVLEFFAFLFLFSDLRSTLLLAMEVKSRFFSASVKMSFVHLSSLPMSVCIYVLYFGSKATEFRDDTHQFEWFSFLQPFWSLLIQENLITVAWCLTRCHQCFCDVNTHRPTNGNDVVVDDPMCNEHFLA